MCKQIQYVTQYVGRGFKNDELRQTKVIHFWKADGIQNTMVGSKILNVNR